MSRSCCARWGAGWLSLLALASGSASAEPRLEVPRVEMVRTEHPPEIDGVLDEPAWAEAPVITDLRQFEPVEGAPASERTEIRLLYDSDFLYLGVRLYDRNPERIIAKELVRDRSLRGDDRITFNIDTFRDRRNGYMFSINPVGSRWDALISNGDVKDEWDGIWYGRSTIDDQGWVTEIAIPLKTVNFDPGGNEWGFNLMRAIRRRNEIVRWTAVNQNLGFNNLSEIGVIRGFEGLDQGLGLDVVPSFSLRNRIDRPNDRETVEGDPSLDVFYKLTPGLTGVLTVNTDFAATEVDERQINLTRFSLFFPEKRDFFLQDAGIFAFAGLEGNGQAFDSRRIGLGPTGEVVDLRIGGKLTGREGPWSLGVLGVRTRHEGALDGELLGVGRVEYNFWEQSRVGVIATRGDPSTNGENALYGADLNLRTARFLGDQELRATFWAQKSSSSDIDGNEGAWGFEIDFPNDRLQLELGLLEVERNFNPALGFTNRTDVRDWRSESRYRWRPGGFFRTIDTGWDIRVVTDRRNHLETARYDWELLELTSQLGDELRFAVIREDEILSAPFEIAPGVIIPTGDYHWYNGNVFLSTADSRALRAELNFDFGDFFTGRIYTTELLLEWAPSAHYFLSLDYEQNDIRLAEGNFTTRVARLRFNWNLNADLAWTNFIQYDNVSDTIGWNSRLRWIIEPGRELFVVFNPGFEVRDRSIHSTVTESVMKLGWTFRY